MKKIEAAGVLTGIAIGVTFSIGALVGGYHALKSNDSIAAAAQRVNENPRFVEIDSSGLSGGTVFVDTKTDIEYIQVVVYGSAGARGIGVSMIPLYDVDGKPLKWTPDKTQSGGSF